MLSASSSRLRQKPQSSGTGRIRRRDFGSELSDNPVFRQVGCSKSEKLDTSLLLDSFGRNYQSAQMYQCPSMCTYEGFLGLAVR